MKNIFTLLTTVSVIASTFAQGNLTVNSGSSITVSETSSLTAAGDLTINSGGSLTVAHTGSVVQTQDAVTVTNNGAISVLVDTPTLDVRDFMIMGSPMSSDTRNDVWSSASVVNKHTTTDFTPYVSPDTNNPVIGYNFYDSDANDWSPVSDNLVPTHGYLIRPQAQVDGPGGVFNYDFNTGTLNTGILTYALDYNSDPGGAQSSPSVLSNPYPSALNIDAFLLENDEIDAVYFWEHNTSPAIGIPSPYVNKYSMEDVSAYNSTGGIAAPSGGVIPNGVISTAQGFGVFATAAGTATFNNGMRLATGNTTLRNSTLSRDRLWLSVTSSAYGLSGNTLIGFIAGATPGVDNKYDNGRIASKVSLYSHIQGSDRGYSIQGREAFDNTMTVSLGFSSIIEEVTSYKISLSDFDGEAWLDATPYLIDNLAGVVTNLMEDSYSFTSDMGQYNDRFVVVFQDRSLGSQQVLASSISMYPNPANDVVTIASPTAAITLVEIRDIRGRLIQTQAVSGHRVAALNVASLDSAIYLVTIATDKGSITTRLIKR
ncbi:T9SS type A sorting domain-containing protein [Flavobacteriaceae bacterium]|nr:T9SS type A sorting domain-containing protein [Flavobacteriaceae bacterium]